MSLRRVKPVIDAEPAPAGAEPSRSSRRVFLAAWLCLGFGKLWLAAQLPLLGDEAWYLQQAARLAPAYSELPGLTAWMVAAGASLAGVPLGPRLVFLLLGLLLPWLFWGLARELLPPVQAWRAALLALCLPLFALMGVLAVPDVALLTLSLAACLLWLRQLRQPRLARWLLLGLVLMLGAWCHYRFVLIWALGALLLGTAAGRRLATRPGLWLAVALGALGWLPLVVFNLQHDGAGLSFQFVDRHPWRFDARGLRQPIEQLAAMTPLLAVLMLARLPELCRRAWTDPRWQLLAGFCLMHLLGFGLLGLFADQQRLRVHWMLAGWLPLLLLLPDWASTRWRWALLALGAGLGAAASALVFVAGLWLASGRLPEAWQQSRHYPDTFVGWRETAERVRWEQQRPGAPQALVADNFMLAAQLAAWLRSELPWVLDHPRNHKHGRALQLRLWQRDAAALAAQDGLLVLVLVEQSAMSGYRWLDWMQSICTQFAAMRPLDGLDFDRGRKRILLFEAVVAGPAAGPGLTPVDCPVPPAGWIDAPAPGARVAAGRVGVFGWASAERGGVAAAWIEFEDGRRVELRLGLPAPQVRAAFPSSVDPDHPNLGWEGELWLEPGRYRLSLVVQGRDGQQTRLAWQTLHVD